MRQGSIVWDGQCSERPIEGRVAGKGRQQPVKRIEISRRAGLDPPIEMNRPLLNRMADQLCDAACEAIVRPLAGQDPPYGSVRYSPPEATAA